MPHSKKKQETGTGPTVTVENTLMKRKKWNEALLTRSQVSIETMAQMLADDKYQIKRSQSRRGQRVENSPPKSREPTPFDMSSHFRNLKDVPRRIVHKVSALVTLEKRRKNKVRARKPTNNRSNVNPFDKRFRAIQARVDTWSNKATTTHSVTPSDMALGVKTHDIWSTKSWKRYVSWKEPQVTTPDLELTSSDTKQTKPVKPLLLPKLSPYKNEPPTLKTIQNKGIKSSDGSDRLTTEYSCGVHLPKVRAYKKETAELNTQKSRRSDSLGWNVSQGIPCHRVRKTSWLESNRSYMTHGFGGSSVISQLRRSIYHTKDQLPATANQKNNTIPFNGGDHPGFISKYDINSSQSRCNPETHVLDGLIIKDINPRSHTENPFTTDLMTINRIPVNAIRNKTKLKQKMNQSPRQRTFGVRQQILPDLFTYAARDAFLPSPRDDNNPEDSQLWDGVCSPSMSMSIENQFCHSGRSSLSGRCPAGSSIDQEDGEDNSILSSSLSTVYTPILGNDGIERTKSRRGSGKREERNVNDFVESAHLNQYCSVVEPNTSGTKLDDGIVSTDNNTVINDDVERILHFMNSCHSAGLYHNDRCPSSSTGHGSSTISNASECTIYSTSSDHSNQSEADLDDGYYNQTIENTNRLLEPPCADAVGFESGMTHPGERLSSRGDGDCSRNMAAHGVGDNNRPGRRMETLPIGDGTRLNALMNGHEISDFNIESPKEDRGLEKEDYGSYCDGYDDGDVSAAAAAVDGGDDDGDDDGGNDGNVIDAAVDGGGDDGDDDDGNDGNVFDTAVDVGDDGGNDEDATAAAVDCGDWDVEEEEEMENFIIHTECDKAGSDETKTFRDGILIYEKNSECKYETKKAEWNSTGIVSPENVDVSKRVRTMSPGYTNDSGSYNSLVHSFDILAIDSKHKSLKDSRLPSISKANLTTTDCPDTKCSVLQDMVGCVTNDNKAMDTSISIRETTNQSTNEMVPEQCVETKTVSLECESPVDDNLYSCYSRPFTFQDEIILPPPFPRQQQKEKPRDRMSSFFKIKPASTATMQNISQNPQNWVIKKRVPLPSPRKQPCYITKNASSAPKTKLRNNEEEKELLLLPVVTFSDKVFD